VPSSRKGPAFCSIFSNGVRSRIGSSFFLVRASLDGVEEFCQPRGILSVTIVKLGAKERGKMNRSKGLDIARTKGVGELATHRARALDLVEEAGHFGGSGRSSGL
jgi:hypothetical protein